MALSLKTAGTWARLVVDGTVAIPGTPAAGDRMFLFASWKDFAITVTDPNGWTPIGTEFADGTTNAGNGAGSVKVMAWYRDWVNGDADPTIDWSSNPTEGHAVIQLWQKDAGESWSTPLTVTGAMTNWTTTSQTFSASSAVAVPSGGVVMGLVGIRDDSGTMTRPSAGIDDGAAAITWNGNYVESPATHFSSTTGLDMSGDLGHRLVTTGATATLRMTGTISAAETGAGKWVVQGVNNNQSVTPTTLALTTATFAPTVSATANVTATPSTLALTLATLAPVIALGIIPPTLALTTETFAPTVTVAAGDTTVTPSTAILTTEAFAPTVTATNHQSVTPGVATLTLAAFAPTVSTPVLATPTTASLILAPFAPTVSVTVLLTPDTAALTFTAYAPTVTATANVSVTPGVVVLTLTSFAPDVASSSPVSHPPVPGDPGWFGRRPMVRRSHRSINPFWG